MSRWQLGLLYLLTNELHSRQIGVGKQYLQPMNCPYAKDNNWDSGSTF